MLLKIISTFILSFSLQAQDLSKPFSLDDEEKSAPQEDISVPVESSSVEPELDKELSIPTLTSPVIDQANILSPKDQAVLAKKIKSIMASNGPQIQILIIQDLLGQSIEEFSIRVAEKWQIGEKEKGNGVIVLMSKNDREIRIEVGEGIEGELTDVDSHQIIQNIFVPNFRQGNFFTGFNQALDAIALEFDVKDVVPQNSRARKLVALRHQKEKMQSLVLPLIIFFVFFPIITRFIGKNPLIRSVAGSTFLAGLIFLFVGQIFFIILAAIFGFIIGMIGPLNFLMAVLSSGGRRGHYGGGMSSGGGWSGGGGGFSGGGASGSW
tara:strand:- start:127140 stop:128108 length:969 start_codon:yes stop_codon:yes gene_type:complete